MLISIYRNRGISGVNMSKVDLKNITKAYDKNVIINEVSLEIKDKEFIVLVGPSGCGKSTILRMIAGLEDISSGEISIGERIVNNVHPKDRNIAMVFQSYALYPHMNVYDNMAFGLKMRKTDKKIIDERVRDAASILDLTEYLDRKPKQLSGGQRQRVALGRAIVREPDVFLMDEPLSNLDAKLRVQMRSEIKKLHQKLATTFIYVTHDQVEAMTMGDRIVILNKGIIQQTDTPENIYNYPENMFVAGFIGSPAMNFIDAKVISETTLSVYGQNLTLDANNSELIKHNQLIGKNVILGVRPEHFAERPKEGLELLFTPTIIEMLGSEKLVHFNMENRQITAKTSPDFDALINQETKLTVDIAKCSIFDTASHKRYKLA